MTVTVNRRNKSIKLSNTLYDPGSNLTFMNENIVRQLKKKIIASKSIFKSIAGLGSTCGRAIVKIKIGDLEEHLNVHVIKSDRFSYDLLLGLDAIKKFKLIQDEELEIHQKVDGRTKKLTNRTAEQAEPKQLVKHVNYNVLVKNEEFEVNLENLNPERRKIIEELIDKHYPVFAKDKFDTGRVKNYEARIKLLEDRYVAKKPYRTSVPDHREIESQIAKLLENGLIEESSSPYASPVTLAFKREDGRKSRLCIDFRDLNKIVVPEAQPFPRIEDILIKVGKCKWFTAFDINSAFWTIPLRRKDRKKTGFITQSGHYQWRVLPFGLKISSAVFQRVLSSIIRKYKLQDFCVNFIDDILCFSPTFEQHVKHIDLLMKAVRREGFRLKLQKCNFAKNSIKYLGHKIANNSVQPINDNLAAIKNFKRPEKRREVRQFLGKINFYFKFLRNPIKTLEPLHDLLRKNVRFVWSERCERAFNEVKNYLCSSPILSIFDPDKETFIFTDASAQGLGAVLKQPAADGVLHPVAYFSKKLTPTQSKMPVIYLECLAIKEAVVFWQFWLIGRQFTVVSDHKPLEKMKVKARTDEPLGDLIHYLSQYDFKIIYAPGESNVEADALSRNPILEKFEQPDIMKAVNLISLQEIVDDQNEIQHEIERSGHTETENGIVFKRLNGRRRIYVSKRLGQRLISKIHDRYGHIGRSHILLRMRPHYYCRHMDRLVGDFTRSCRVCAMNKTRRRRRMGFLSRLGPAERPFQILSLDTIGGFAGNRSRKRYLHLLVDHFTRFAWIRTSSTQNATDFIKLLEPIIEKENVEILLADQYTGINAVKLKECLKKHRVRLVFTAVDCAESNGLNERLNQTIVNRLRCKINSDTRNKPWSVLADECLREYNSTQHSVTKFAPEYLLLGKRDEIVPAQLSGDRDLEDDRRTAKRNSDEDHRRNKERVDGQRKQHEFEIGQEVYVSNGSKLNRGKLEEVRIGPFKIVKKISNSMFEVACGKRRSEANIFHVSKLLPTS